VALVGALAALALLAGRQGASATPDLLLLTPVPPTGAHFSSPVYLTAPPGDQTRIMVVQQGGIIRLVKGVAVTDFMTVPNVLAGGERGLLSMAFAPDYATSGRFYVYYTRVSDGAIQVDEFLRSRFHTRASRITTAGSSSSAPMECSTWPRATEAEQAIRSEQR
jgi:glucose/arabinose dehydrogenase